MKNIIFMIVMLPLVAFADGKTSKINAEGEGEAIELALGLEVIKECENDICVILSGPPNVHEFQLEADYDGCGLPQPGSCLPWSYVSRVSTVESLNGVRYISIVTVRKNIMGRGEDNKPIGYSYSIDLEILGDKGLEARAHFYDIKDITKFDAINLGTIPKKVHGGTYYASLFVGDKNDGSQTPPGQCDSNGNCTVPVPETPSIPEPVEPNLIKNLTLEKGLILK